MKKSRFTNEQIAFALQQAESGVPVEEVCRKLGVSQPTFYRWKKKFHGMGVEELRRLKSLEEEIKRLKGLSPISVWTSRFCRMSYQKNSRTCSSAYGSRGRPAGVEGQ